MILMRVLIMFILIGSLGYTIHFELFAGEKVVLSPNKSMAPSFVLNDLRGNEYELTNYRGKGVFINFWGTYCPPCEKEMPYIENAYQEYREKGIQVLAVNVDEPMRIVNQFVSRKQLSFPILLDRQGEVLDLYHVQNLPVTFLVNEDGIIEDKILGQMTEDDIRGFMEQIKPK